VHVILFGSGQFIPAFYADEPKKYIEKHFEEKTKQKLLNDLSNNNFYVCEVVDGRIEYPASLVANRKKEEKNIKKGKEKRCVSCGFQIFVFPSCFDENDVKAHGYCPRCGIIFHKTIEMEEKNFYKKMSKPVDLRSIYKNFVYVEVRDYGWK